mmetsp:Transcript_9788/g.10537  ORF Transcript_9788/g.10537 Transcript_9788/m.10537 type:complete len:175 (+) Transcript_9788:7-531(+)
MTLLKIICLFLFLLIESNCKEYDIFEGFTMKHNSNERYQLKRPVLSFSLGKILAKTPLHIILFSFLLPTVAYFTSIYGKHVQLHQIEQEHREIWTILLNLHNSVVRLREETMQEINTINALLKTNRALDEQLLRLDDKFQKFESRLLIIKRNEQKIVSSIRALQTRLNTVASAS